MSMLEKPKRILMLNYEFPPLGGGGGVAAKNLAKGYINDGYQVDYVTTWYKGWKKEENVEGINVFRIKVFGRKDQYTATMISMISFVFLAFRKTMKLCKKHQYLFINTHFVVPTGPLGFLIAGLYKIPHILSIHGGDIYDPSKKLSPHRKTLFRKVVKKILNNVDVLVAQSTNTKNNAIKYYAVDRGIHIIPLPYIIKEYTIPDRSTLNMRSNVKYIIGVGRLIKRKNYQDFIRTLSLMPDDVEGIILGEGPERDYLSYLAGDLGVQKRLQMPGFVSEEVKFQYLYNADLFLLSSLHEGFGIIIQEAFQAGLPVVATNNGGQVDLVKNNENGFLVSVGDCNDMAEKIMFLFSNIEIKNNISANNKVKIHEFETANICKKYMSLYFSAIKNH